MAEAVSVVTVAVPWLHGLIARNERLEARTKVGSRLSRPLLGDVAVGHEVFEVAFVLCDESFDDGRGAGPVVLCDFGDRLAGMERVEQRFLVDPDHPRHRLEARPSDSVMEAMAARRAVMTEGLKPITQCIGDGFGLVSSDDAVLDEGVEHVIDGRVR